MCWQHMPDMHGDRERRSAMSLLLRDVIRRLLQERKKTQLELVGQLNGKIQQANLSAVLNGKRRFTLNMLDAITEALGLEKGSLYHYYEQECFDKWGNLRPKKAAEFILCCYEMGLGHVTRRLVNRLVEHGSENTNLLFSIAERLFEAGLFMESMYFYNTVIDMETGIQAESDRFCVSCYRRFVVHETLQTDTVYDAFVVLAGCLKNQPKKAERPLPGDSDNLQFDAYRKAIAYCIEQEMWHRVITLGEQFANLAISEQDSLAFGQSLLCRAEAVLSLHQLQLASYYVEQCAEIPVPSLQIESQTFRLRLAMKRGDLSVLDECLDWLRKHPDQITTLFPAMLQACLLQDRLPEAGRVVACCKEAAADPLPDPSHPRWKKWNARLQRLLADYLIRSGNVAEGWEHLLSALQIAITLQRTTDVIDCMLLYERVRKHVPPQQQEQMTELLRSGSAMYRECT